MVPGRTQYQFSFLIPLLSQISNEEDNQVGKQISDHIPLSNQEYAYLENGFQAVQSWMNISQNGGENQPVEIYRYFRQFGKAGVAAIFIGLGEFLDNNNNQERWVEHLDRARYFLEGYWEHHQEWVDPPALLDGYEIQIELGIPPGPAIGSLLEILREEQVRVGVNTKEEGLNFLKSQFPRSEKSKS
jgi:hypothetical protein